MKELYIKTIVTTKLMFTTKLMQKMDVIDEESGLKKQPSCCEAGTEPA